MLTSILALTTLVLCNSSANAMHDKRNTLAMKLRLGERMTVEVT